jgi:hypothetical protein
MVENLTQIFLRILMSESALNIFYNIVGGLLTVPCTAAFALFWRKCSKRQFRKIFGPGAKSFTLSYGSLVISPLIVNGFIPPSERSKYMLFPFAKASVPDRGFSADHVGGGSEIRSAAYLSAGLRLGGSDSVVYDDESIKDRLDLDFISFGYNNNLKTLDLVANDTNCFVVFDDRSDGFVTKASGRIVFRPSPGWDYGIVLRIHPAQFPTRTWICCAGYGEWGTSGSAWRDLAGRLRGDEPFVAIVKVKQGQDESAMLVGLFKEARALEEFVDAARSESLPSIHTR